MAGKITTPEQLQTIQDYVRQNHASLTAAQLEEIHSEVEDYAGRSSAPAAPSAAPAAPAGPDGMSTPQLTPEDMAAAQANAEAFQRGVTDKAHKAIDLAAKVVRNPDEELDAAIEQLRRDRKQALEAAKAPAGASPRGFYGAGDVAPDILLGGVAGLGRGVLARSVLGAGAGAVSGAMADPHSDNLPSQFAVGGTLGMATTLMGEVPNMVRNVVGARIIRAYDRIGTRGDQGASILRPTQDSRLAEIDLPPSEATGSASLARNEARVPQDLGNPKYEALRKRSDQVVQSFTKTAGLLGATDAEAGTILGRASQLYDSATDQIRNNAQIAFNDAIAPILPLSGAKMSREGIITEGKAIVPVPNYVRVMRDMRQRAVDMGATPGELSQFDSLMAHTVDVNSGRMKLGELQQSLHDYGKGSVGTGTVGKQAVDASRFIDNRLLFGALMDDMGNVAKNAPPDFWSTLDVRARFEPKGPVAPPMQKPVGPQLGPGRVMVEKGTGEYIPKDGPVPENQFAGNDIEGTMAVSGKTAQAVADALQRARDGYKTAIAPLNDLQKQGIDALLGSEKLLGTAEFAKKFRAMDTDQQKAVFNLLDGRRPELADNLRGVLFLDAVKQAKTQRVSVGKDLPDSLPESIDIPKLKEYLSDNPAKLELLLPQSAKYAGQSKRVLAGLSVLSRIQKANLEGGTGQAQTWSHELATGMQNLVSRNSIFLAKWLTGEVAPHVLERWLYTPEGINSLLKVASYQPGRGAITSTVREGMRELYRISTEAENDHQKLLEELQAKQAEMEQQHKAAFQPGALQ